MEIDIEMVHKAAGRSRFEQWLAVLFGAAAMIAALLATLEMHSSKQWEKFSTEGADLSVELFGKIAATGPANAAEVSAQQIGLLRGLVAGSRIEQPEAQELDQVAALIDFRLEDHLLRLAKDIGAVPEGSGGLESIPGASDGLDPVAQDALETTREDLTELARDQAHAVDEAERYSTRISRAVFALSLLALAAILLGLAAVLGVAGRGTIVLIAAAAALLVSSSWGASALFV